MQHEIGLTEKMYFCRMLHFYRAYLGIKIRIAVEILNARRTAETQVDADAASEWYLWFGIGREAAGDLFPPVPSLHTHPGAFRLVNALVYEASLEDERRLLAERAAVEGVGDLPEQIAAIEKALGEMRALIEEYWAGRSNPE